MAGIAQGEYVRPHFFGQAISTDMRNQRLLCAVFLDQILLVDIRKHKAEWVIDTSSIKFWETLDRGIVIYTTENKHKKGRFRTAFLIPFAASKPRAQLLETLDEAVSYHK